MRILCYGDSNTWGYNPVDGSRYENRYTNILKKECISDEIIEEGLNGRTLSFDDPFDPDRNGTKNISMVIKSHVPLDLIIIMLGTNDSKRIFSSNGYSLEKGCRHLLSTIKNPELYRKVNKVPKILVARPPRMHPTYMENESTFANFGVEGFNMLENANDYLEPCVQLFDADYLDTNIIAGDYDGIHLSTNGHRELANKLIKKMEDYR